MTTTGKCTYPSCSCHFAYQEEGQYCAMGYSGNALPELKQCKCKPCEAFRARTTSFDDWLRYYTWGEYERT
jgi:hypothetical protein